jgi:probable rRNA maturation factor
LPVRRLLRQLKKSLALLSRPLPVGLKEISFVLVDRKTMARVHGDFLGDATETDVMTFPYGEILICPAVAREQAEEFGQRVEEEVLLYGLHGLLHLAGYEDAALSEAKQMARAQEELLRRVMKEGRGGVA